MAQGEVALLASRLVSRTASADAAEAVGKAHRAFLECGQLLTSRYSVDQLAHVVSGIEVRYSH